MIELFQKSAYYRHVLKFETFEDFQVQEYVFAWFQPTKPSNILRFKQIRCFMLAVLFRKMLPNPMRSSQAAAPDLNNMPDECRLKISDRMRNKMRERGQIDCWKICEMTCQDISGFFEKNQPSCHTHCEETCMPPFPQFNVVTSLCWERPSKKTTISVRMPACTGQQH